MRYIKILLIYIKRCLKSPSFIAAAVIIPLLVPFFGELSLSKGDGLLSGFYAEGESAVLCSALEGAGFIRYDSPDALRRDVENETLNCGFILPEDIYTAVKENRHRSITCLISPSSVLGETASEALFAVLARLYAPDMAVEYMDKNGIGYDKEALLEYYSTYLDEGKAIGIEYTYIGEDGSELTEDEDAGGNVSLGLLGVYILLGGILGINKWIEDEKRSLPFGAANVFSSVLVLTLCACVSLVISDRTDIYAILRLCLYLLAVCGFCCIVKAVVGTHSALVCGLLPVLVIGSLLLCPIFIDLSALVPLLGVASYLFLPVYLLSPLPVLAAAAAVLVPIGAACIHIKGLYK